VVAARVQEMETFRNQFVPFRGIDEPPIVGARVVVGLVDRDRAALVLEPLDELPRVVLTRRAAPRGRRWRGRCLGRRGRRRPRFGDGLVVRVLRMVPVLEVVGTDLGDSRPPGAVSAADIDKATVLQTPG
jgi:hypothetical protein